MKLAALGFLTFVPLVTQAAEVTFVVFRPQNSEFPNSTRTATEAFIVPIGTNDTIVASASGFKGTKMQGFDSIDCRYTDDKAGECLYRYDDVKDGQTTSVTSTATGVPHGIVVSVSETSGGASPTVGESGGSDSGDGNGSNGATSIALGKTLAGVLGGLVMGAYAALLC
ncbi:hypothetical protein PQX77_012039 [Marasmius sp. AFHP31]|nr:hypothetical protein PQX77_012039 [Marasmius sp. AFHP31]